MCQTKTSTDLSIPAAIGAVVLTGIVISSAAAIITSVLLTLLVVLLTLSAAGLTALVIVLRRDRTTMWQPASARQAARPAPARPARAWALAAEPILALSVPSLRAIEGPSVLSGTFVRGELLAAGSEDATPEHELAAVR